MSADPHPSLFDTPREPGEVRITDPWPKDQPWPWTVAAPHGFTPEAIKQAKAMLREVASVLVGERPDKAFLVPVLVTSLTADLNDFVRYHQRDQSEGFATPEDRHRFMVEATARMQAWDAQPTEPADGTR